MIGKILYFSSSVFLFIVLLTSCAEPKYFWETKPTSNKMGMFVCKIYRLNTLDQTPVETDAAQIPELNLWMPSMGHESLPTETLRIDIGTYCATNVFFIMPGEWQLKFQMKNGTEILDEAEINYTFHFFHILFNT